MILIDFFKKIHFYSAVDVGLERSHNEDYVSQDDKHRLLILADGMGGQNAGEVASLLAVKIIQEEIVENFKQKMGHTEISELIEKAIIKANTVVFNIAQSQPRYKGMGTTVVVAFFYDDQVFIAHVGDSRLYRLRSQQLEQLTSDHSLVQETVDKGYYTEEQARQAIANNLITRAVGVDNFVEPSIDRIAATPKDCYLLCSDGLSDMLDKEQILDVLQNYGSDLKKAANQLINLANDHGGKDNISVMLAYVSKPFKVGISQSPW